MRLWLLFISVKDHAVSYCECELAGYCKKHGTEKTERDVEICKGINVTEANREAYRRAWEEGRTYAQRVARQKGSSQVIVTSAVNSAAGNVASPKQSKSVLAAMTTDDMPCEHRGIKLRDHKCAPCRGSITIPVFECNHPEVTNRECSLAATVPNVSKCSACEFGGEDLFEEFMESRRDDARTVAIKKNGNSWVRAFRYGRKEAKQVRYITKEQFAKDTHNLITKIPHDVTAVVGVARSGVYPSSLASMMLHLPLYFIRQAQNDVVSPDIVSAGNGWRLSEGTRPVESGRVVIIDDTVMTGNSMQAIRPIVDEMFPNSITAAVYCNPMATLKPDIHSVDLPWPHLLEWNIFNSVVLQSMAIDFDGILCQECSPHQDDDGSRYLDFLANVRPNYLVRKAKVPLIVTARLEKYRKETERWLKKWNVQYSRLVMGPWKDNHERSQNDIAAYKAHHFKFFADRVRGLKPAVFVESDVHQARRIAELSGHLAVCPIAGKCFNG